MGTTTRSNASNAKTATKNKSTSTKDKDTGGNNNVTATDKQQQQNQRAGTPPYTTQQQKTGMDQPKSHDNNIAKAMRPAKTSKSVEPPKISQKKTPSSTVSTSTTNSSSGKENATATTGLPVEQHQQCKKKRLYKSASSTEMLCTVAAGISISWDGGIIEL